MPDFRSFLNGRDFMIFDGAMGTMLQGAGLPAGMQPEKFCLENPNIVAAIHRLYVQSGANILTTATFGANRLKLPADINVFNFNRQMAEVAGSIRPEFDRPVFVAGDIGPSGHFARPLGDVEPVKLVEVFREQVRGLLAGGVDVFIIETQFDLAEAKAAVTAVKLECELPIIVSMTFENGVNLTGSTPEIFAETMQNLGVDVIGTNCSAGPDEMLPVVQRLLACCHVPVLAEPNAGLPQLIDGETVFPLDPAVFAQKTLSFAQAGVKILGGCCGTTPEHIRSLSNVLRTQKWQNPCKVRENLGIVLTTRSNMVHIGQGYRPVLIGERINPTGKKKLSLELQAGEFSQALAYADEQLEKGATVLDVNVGAPLVDETVLLPKLVVNLTERYDIPLSLDSSNVEAIKFALPYCAGSPLVNSINGENGRMEILGSLCRDWGAPFILLPICGKNLPVRAADRIAILEKLLDKAQQLHIPKRLIMIDVLALSVSSQSYVGKEALETIRWCTRNGYPTTMGLSNVSFGLPARELLNATYASMCIGNGLTSCIANPANRRLLEVFGAAASLLGVDAESADFIKNYSSWSDSSHSTENNIQDAAVVKDLYSAVLYGDRDNVLTLVKQDLNAGEEPFTLVQKKLIPAISEVGKKYESKEFFLPQLIRAAETMQIAFNFLRPLLAEKGGDGLENRPVIVMATVEGDIHDIGKNIVSLLLENYGFKVIDAGKDVPAALIVDCALKNNASLIGLSALMTTTMVKMEETVKLVKMRNLSIKVLIGGAVVTQMFADSIGADGYAPDAVSAVRVAKQLLESA